MDKLFKTLKISTDSRGVMTVILNRPAIKNAFNQEMIDEFTEVFSKEVFKPEIRIIVMRGEGTHFSAGGDLNWMKKSIELNYEQNLDDTRKLTQMFALMNECPKPLLGAIHGAAIGGGVGLVSVCDFVIATAETQFSLSEVRLGIVPACIGPFVIAKIGASHARNLFVTARRFLATQAKEIGLIHEVVSDQKSLEVSLNAIIESMLQCGPQAMIAAKKLVLDLSWPERRNQNRDCYESVAEALARLRVSEEGQEGLRAFLEKRKPSWIS